MAKKRDRVIRTALAVSFAVHLSAVTLFSIVITFPREPVKYYSFRFVDAATREPIFRSDVPWPRTASIQPELRVPSLEEALGDDLGEDAIIAPLSGPELPPPAVGDALSLAAEPELPPIDIPQLEFAELARLDLRRESLRIRSGYAEELGQQPRDSWAWFGRELGELRNSLRSLPAGLQSRKAGTAPEPVVVSTPHPGFRAYIEWMAGPKNRQLLFSPPIDALMGVGGSSGAQPIALVFRVNPQGRVIEVVDTGDDEAGITASASKALIKYRFAPVDLESGDQYGTLVIVSADSRP